MSYTNGFKSTMVKRLVGPERISASALSREVGVSQATLSRWKQQARTLPAMSGSKDKSERDAKSSRQWSSKEKLQVVVDAAQLSDEELGGFLRSRGLHTSQLEEWHLLALQALEGSTKPKRRKASPEAKQVKALEKELLRKDRALAEVTALLALEKRMQDLWGDEDDDTTT